MTQPIEINTAALGPLFPAWEEPNKHRVRTYANGVAPHSPRLVARATYP